jgi:DNA-binding NtrC family response regulator
MGALKLEVRSLRETALRDTFCSETPVVTGTFFRHSEFSATEIEAVRQLVGHSIAAVERELICETLMRRGGNRTHAAAVLGISVRALRNKIRMYKDRGRRVPDPNRYFRPAPDGDSSA